MISRREVLIGIGGTLAGGLLAATATPCFAISNQGAYPWKPHKLDPMESAKMAYDGFWEDGRGCCYGVFKGIVGLMGMKHGAPYNTFPLGMMSFGASGVSNWGTLCGSLNGAAAAFGLFWERNDQEPLVDNLFNWYEKAKLPGYKPDKPRINIEMPETVAESVLCHVSISKWCYKTGFEMHSQERSERCARVTAIVAQKTAELINSAIDNKVAAAIKSDNRATCNECHDKGGESDILKGKMDCMPCHGGDLVSKFKDHP